MGAEVGADAPQAWMQVLEGPSNSVGVSLWVPAESPLAEGSKHLATLRFLAEQVGVHELRFSDVPVVRAVDGDPSAASAVLWEDGQVSVAGTGLEGDIYPQPCGDGIVDAQDAHLALLIALGAADPPTDPDEFQRLDCAPIETCGDGIIDIADKVAILRYANGQAELRSACGPTGPAPGARLASPSSPGPSERTLSMDAPAEVRRGDSFWVSIALDAQGDEHALSASLSFDPEALAYQDMSLSSAAAGGLFLPNLETAAEGAIAFALILPDGQTFAAGDQGVVDLLFTVPEGAATGQTAAAFAQLPAECRVAGLDSESLPAVYSGASVEITGSIAASAALAPESGQAEALSMNRIKVSWSPVAWSTGYRIRRKLEGESVWIRLADVDATRTVLVDDGLPPGTGCGYLVTSLNPQGDESSPLRLDARTWTETEAWRDRWLGGFANEGFAADDEDPDFDGLPNRLEYQLGTDPLVPDAFPFTFAFEELFPGSRSLTLSYMLRADAPGAVDFEFTGDLRVPLSWRGEVLAPVSFRREGASDFIKVRLPEGTATNRMLFLRMKSE
jgi:hypothetical protein